MASLWDYLNAVNDASKAFASGAVTGASQIAGIPGEIRQGVRAGTDPLLDRLDAALGYQAPTTRQPYYDILPTGQQLDNAIRQHVTGPAYNPQTAFGRGAQAVGEMLPSFAFSGMAAKAGDAAMAAGNDLTRAYVLNALAGGQLAGQGVQSAGSLAGDPRAADVIEALRKLLTNTVVPGGGIRPAY
jgi:hypothetical protein